MITTTLSRLARAATPSLCAAAFVSIASLSSTPALACGGTRGGVQGPAPTPPCTASTVIYKQVRQPLIGPIITPTFPLLVSNFITTQNCPTAVRLEITLGVFNSANQLVGAGSIDVMNPQVGVVTQRVVNVLRLQQPAIPTGIYTVIGSATVTLANGNRFTNSGDTCLAVVDPSPADPTQPRLNVEILNFPNDPAHAGDHIASNYRITNNDPVHTYTGDFVVRNKNSATQPSIDLFNPGSEPFFVYSIAAPVPGANFPLGFANDLPPGACLPLPPNPADPAIPEIVSTITLAPGESVDMPVVSRGWGMCSGGSGCEQIGVLSGFFSDGTMLEACAGGAAIVDDSVPPTYECDDGESGAAAFVVPMGPGNSMLEWVGLPSPTSEILLKTDAPQLIPVLVNGLPRGAQLRTVVLNDRWARYEWTILNDGTGPNPGDLIQASLPVRFTPSPNGPPLAIVDAGVMPMPGEPFGFAEFYPFGKGMLTLNHLTSPLLIDSFFDVFFQLEAAQFGGACDNPRGQSHAGSGGEPLPMESFSLSFAPSAGGAEFTAAVGLMLPPCDSPPSAVTLAVNIVRGFSRAAAGGEPCPGDTNGDGVINFSDLNAVLSAFGQVGSGIPGDVNDDGIVNFSDLNIVLSNFGTVCAQ